MGPEVIKPCISTQKRWNLGYWIVLLDQLVVVLKSMLIILVIRNTCQLIVLGYLLFQGGTLCCIGSTYLSSNVS
jgi:hypothetical protein